jgi:hypothetical protein
MSRCPVAAAWSRPRRRVDEDCRGPWNRLACRTPPCPPPLLHEREREIKTRSFLDKKEEVTGRKIRKGKKWKERKRGKRKAKKEENKKKRKCMTCFLEIVILKLHWSNYFG